MSNKLNPGAKEFHPGRNVTPQNKQQLQDIAHQLRRLSIVHPDWGASGGAAQGGGGTPLFLPPPVTPRASGGASQKMSPGTQFRTPGRQAQKQAFKKLLQTPPPTKDQRIALGKIIKRIGPSSKTIYTLYELYPNPEEHPSFLDWIRLYLIDMISKILTSPRLSNTQQRKDLYSFYVLLMKFLIETNDAGQSSPLTVGDRAKLRQLIDALNYVTLLFSTPSRRLSQDQTPDYLKFLTELKQGLQADNLIPFFARRRQGLPASPKKKQQGPQQQAQPQQAQPQQALPQQAQPQQKKT